MGEDSAVTLETGPAANLVGLCRLGGHNSLLAQRGVSRVTTYPAKSRFTFGGGRTGEVRHAAEITAGKAGNKGLLQPSS